MHILWLLWLLTTVPLWSASGVHHDICNTTTEITRLELWDTGTLGVLVSTNQSRASCQLQILGCDVCRLNVTVMDVQLPGCRTNLSQVLKLPTCIPGCAHLVVYEPSYPDVSTRFYLSSVPTTPSASFISISSSVMVMLCLPDTIRQDPLKVLLHYDLIEKKVVLEGSHLDPTSQHGTLKSPNFPHGYALRGEVYVYTLHNIDPGGFIRLVFDDWDVAPHSRLVFYANESSHDPLATYFGSSVRPLVLVPGPLLHLTFYPDVGLSPRTTNMGFQATYTFSSKLTKDDRASTDCGTYYKYLAGGNITFYRPLLHQAALYDCVWVVTPHSAFDWVLLRLVNLSLGNHAWLSVRSGVTSDRPLVANLTTTTNGSVPMTTQYEGGHGFYVRLQGVVTSGDLVSMVFAAFNRVRAGGCSHAGEFECISGHCIDSHLACDGHVHCEDGLDEGAPCKVSPVAVSPPPMVCKPSEFACTNGRRCVPKSSVCDAWLDCQDGSDEYKCEQKSSTPNPADPSADYYEAVTCDADMQSCHHGRQCVLPSQFCDGHYDCWDRSDEMHCSLGYHGNMSRPAPWNILMPLGIALCVLLSLCVLALCIRTHVKQDAHSCNSHSSGSHRQQSHARCPRRGRNARSVTSETPLTLDLSRSTSGVTTESPMPDSPPSYEEAMRRSPDGATAPNSANADSNTSHPVSPAVLSPPAYHIPITGKQHFSFSLWPLTSSSSSSRPRKPQPEDANVQLLASEFNSSSGTSEPGSTVCLNNLPEDGSTAEYRPTSQNADMEAHGDDSVITGDSVSIGTVTTCSSVRDYGLDLRGSFHEASLGSRNSFRSDKTHDSSKTSPKRCHCHCKGHENRRPPVNKLRSRSTSSDRGLCPHLQATAQCTCGISEVKLKELCLKNRNAKELTSCDSREEECLLMEPDSPLLCDIEDESMGSPKSTFDPGDVPNLLGVKCLVHENGYCDTVC